MYQAKAGGKGRITVLDQQARAEARDKLRLVTELRDAIDGRDIALLYQPIFGTGDRRRRSPSSRWPGGSTRSAARSARRSSCRWPRRAA